MHAYVRTYIRGYSYSLTAIFQEILKDRELDREALASYTSTDNDTTNNTNS